MNMLAQRLAFFGKQKVKEKERNAIVKTYCELSVGKLLLVLYQAEIDR